jgi:addiction module HigA family antidote
MVRIPTHREPTHPGEMLLKEFLQPMGMSQQDLARQIRVPFQRVNELVNRRRGITPATALRLSRLFGNTPDFWVNLQIRWDLYRSQKKEAQILKKIQPIKNGAMLQPS